MTTREGGVRVERSAKRVRVQLGGTYVADSTDVKLVWEKPYYPTYYFPRSDVRMDLFVSTGEREQSPSRGIAEIHTVKAERGEAIAAARLWDQAEIGELADHVSFRWSAFDHWYEEDEEVYVHARDPYTRVDILQSSRHVEVLLAGVKVAESSKPRLLFETGLPTRYYLPKTDVAMEYLTPTHKTTACPYKGTAAYWSATVDGECFDDIAWSYPAPLRESAAIAGFIAFYNERVDLRVDGELQERPRTMFS